MVKVHHDHTRAHEQRQLQKRMVDHMLHSSRESCHDRLVFACGAHKHRHGDAGKDKPDLGHGRTGKRALEIDREQRQDCSQKHCDHSGCQHDQAEPVIPCEHIQSGHQDPVDADFGQDARQQRGSR